MANHLSQAPSSSNWDADPNYELSDYEDDDENSSSTSKPPQKTKEELDEAANYYLNSNWTPPPPPPRANDNTNRQPLGDVSVSQDNRQHSPFVPPIDSPVEADSAVGSPYISSVAQHEVHETQSLPTPRSQESSIFSSTSQQWAQVPSSPQLHHRQDSAAFPLGSNDLSMDESLVDIQMTQNEGDDYCMNDDKNYTVEQIPGLGADVVPPNFGEAVWIQMQRQQENHQNQQNQEVLFQQFFSYEGQQEHSNISMGGQEAQLGSISNDSFENLLNRSYIFWNSIPLPAKPCPPSLSHPNLVSNPTPSFEPTPKSEKKSPRRPSKELLDCEREGPLYRSVFPYAAVSAMGSSTASYHLRSKQALSRVGSDPYPRAFRIRQVSKLPSKRTVEPEDSLIYGTPAVRKLHEDLKAAHNPQITRESTNTLGKRSVGDNEISAATSESPSKRPRRGDVAQSYSFDEVEPSSAEESKSANSSSQAKPKSPSHKNKSQKRSLETHASSPPASPLSSSPIAHPLETPEFVPNLPVQSAPLKRQSTLERLMGYTFIRRGNVYQVQAQKGLRSALRQSSARHSSQRRPPKKVTFLLPPAEDAVEDDTDTDTDVEDDMEDKENSPVKRTPRSCSGLLSSISGMFRFGGIRSVGPGAGIQ